MKPWPGNAATRKLYTSGFSFKALTLIPCLFLSACTALETTPAQNANIYLKLGYEYKNKGWSEKARAALNKAIALDKDGPDGQKAQFFLRARLPKYPITQLMEEENIIAFNLGAEGKTEEAEAEFKRLIEIYPKFEWPYGNLGALYISEGKTDEAIAVLKQALAINPYYANGWKNLAIAYRAAGNISEAEACSQKEEEVLPAAMQE